MLWAQERLRSSKSNIFPKKSQRFAEVLADIYFFVYLQAEHPQTLFRTLPRGQFKGPQKRDRIWNGGRTEREVWGVSRERREKGEREEEKRGKRKR